MDRTLDYLIIVMYLISIALIGILSGGEQKSVKDYFFSVKSIHWLIVLFPIIAVETSTLTFISIPGRAYFTNLNFIQRALGFKLGRISE